MINFTESYATSDKTQLPNSGLKSSLLYALWEVFWTVFNQSDHWTDVENYERFRYKL